MLQLWARAGILLIAGLGTLPARAEVRASGVHRADVARAAGGGLDLSKGRPPAVLDARVGVNTRLGDDPAALPAAQRGQAEPHIVRSTSNPDTLLATFQEGRYADGGAIGCGYSVSRDGGLTWTRALVPNLTFASGGRFNRATDPVAGAGPQGDLYLQALGSLVGAFDLAAVVVSRSTDTGATWGPPVTVYEPPSRLIAPDKNWLAVNDFPGTPNYGRLVSTWTNFISNAAGGLISTPIVASVSDDRGVSWAAPIDINPLGANNQGTQPVFLPDGSLAVVYIRFLDVNDVNRFRIECKRSLDGGRTYPALPNVVVAAVAGWDDPELRDGTFLPAVAVARGSGAIFVTYVAVVAGSPRVLVTASLDGGVSWRTPVAISDQPAGVSVMNPAIAVTPDGRSVSVIFMDKRHAVDGRNFVDLSVAQSFDGGTAWQPNLRLTEMSSDIRFGPQTERGVMLGDYLGLAPSLAADQPCVAVWCDTRTGDSDPFVVRFTPQPQESFDAWRIARFQPGDFGGKGAAGGDPDGDGELNVFEYLGGGNPWRAEWGEAMMVSGEQGAGRRVVWAQRKALALAGELTVSGVDFLGGKWPTGTLKPLGTGTAGALLPVLPAGLIWQGVETPAGAAGLVTREYVFSGDALSGRTLTTDTVRSGAVTFGTSARLINLAARGFSGIGASQLIVGFVIDGDKSILVRAAGPALAGFGVTGNLAEPRLSLQGAAVDVSLVNDRWELGSASAALFARLGAFPFGEGSRDAALVQPLSAASYTAVVSGVNATVGTVLVEVYDGDRAPGGGDGGRLVNLSARALVRGGDDALAAGFVIGGTQPRRVLIRAVGPTLGEYGVTGVLADPVLRLYQGATPLAINDDWEISRSGAALAVTAQRVGAFALAPASLDAALLITLAPGAYTVLVAGVAGTAGLVLVEIYDAD